MKDPLVSLILIIDSALSDINGVLQSIKKQTYKNLEVVICLTKNSIYQSSELDKLINQISLQNCCILTAKTEVPAEAYNLSLSKATGNFFIIIEGQTFLREDALTEMTKVLAESLELGFVYSSEFMFSDQRHLGGEVKTSGPFDLNKALFRNFFPLSSLFRREIWDRGLRFDSALIFPEWDFWLKVLTLGFKATYIGKPLLERQRVKEGFGSRRGNFHYLGLAQVVIANQGIYGEELFAWASGLVRQAKAGVNEVSYIIVSNFSGKESENYAWKFAKCLAKSGKFVSFLGPNEKAIEFRESIHVLRCDGFNVDLMDHHLSRLGDRLALFSFQQPSFLIAQKANKNIFARALLVEQDLQELDPLSIKAINLIVCRQKLDQNFKGKAEEEGVKVIDTFDLNYCEEVEHDFYLGNVLGPNYEVEQVIESFTGTHLSVYPKQEIDRLGQMTFVVNQLLLEALQCRDKFSEKIKRIKDVSREASQSLQRRELDLSVVIPCRNIDESRLKLCLMSLRDQTNLAEVEVIVSDYGSSPATSQKIATVCEEYRVRHVFSRTSQVWSRSRSLNIGIRTAKAKWVMTTDADMLFAVDFFIMLARYLENFGSQCIFFAQPIKLPPLKLPNSWRAEDFQKLAIKGRLFGEQGRGGCQVVLRSWLEGVRGFNEAYTVWGNEDDDMFERAGWDGLKRVWLEPGKYLHQWHMKSINPAARQNNSTVYQQVKMNPRLIVNDENWGRISSNELNYVETNQDQTSTPLSLREIENLIISLEGEPEGQAQMLKQYGDQALINNQVDSALELLEDAVHLCKNDPNVFISMAKAYVKAGLVELAVINIDRAIEIDPRHNEALQIREILRTV